MDKKKRINLDFTKKQEPSQEAVQNGDVYIDNSGEELRRMQEEMRRRRENDLDDEGMSIQMRPKSSHFELLRRLLKG